MKIRLIVCTLLLTLVGSAAEIHAANLSSTVKIGVLASLTGSGSSLGKNTVAALEIAANQIETATRGRTRFRFLGRATGGWHLRMGTGSNVQQRGHHAVLIRESTARPLLSLA